MVLEQSTGKKKKTKQQKSLLNLCLHLEGSLFADTSSLIDLTCSWSISYIFQDTRQESPPPEMDCSHVSSAGWQLSAAVTINKAVILLPSEVRWGHAYLPETRPAWKLWFRMDFHARCSPGRTPKTWGLAKGKVSLHHMPDAASALKGPGSTEGLRVSAVISVPSSLTGFPATPPVLELPAHIVTGLLSTFQWLCVPGPHQTERQGCGVFTFAFLEPSTAPGTRCKISGWSSKSSSSPIEKYIYSKGSREP